MECITYKKGYKYQLHEEYQLQIQITPPVDILTDYIDLTAAGLLIIKKGYAWDGPSGPTIDTPNFMRGSLVHDALYQLMRNNLLDRKKWRNPADRLIQQHCKEDGMSRFRAGNVYWAVNKFGKKSASEKRAKKQIKAPRRCR